MISTRIQETAAERRPRLIKGGGIMAYDIAVDVNISDIVLTDDGDIMLIDNAERVAQQIVISLRFWLGEWFLDTSLGVPYLEYVLVKNPNINHVRQVIAEAIMQVTGVSRVDRLDFDYDAPNRALSVIYEVETDKGLITRKEVLGYGG